jgi:DICT domain-containing protein
MAVAVYAARAALPLSYWPYVGVVVGVGGVVYVAALVALSHQFRATVLAVAADAGLR